jgi:hypothetical protein
MVDLSWRLGGDGALMRRAESRLGAGDTQRRRR